MNKVKNKYSNEQKISKALKLYVQGIKTTVYSMKLSFKIVAVEEPIYIFRKRRGVVDLIARQEGKTYAVEIKCGEDTNAFWEASKVIAYAKVLSHTTGTKYRPAVLLPQGGMNADIFVIAYILNLAVFSYYYDEQKDLLIVKREFDA